MPCIRGTYIFMQKPCKKNIKTFKQNMSQEKVLGFYLTEHQVVGRVLKIGIYSPNLGILHRKWEFLHILKPFLYSK